MTVAFVKKGTRANFGSGSSAAPTLASVGAGNLVVLTVAASRGDTAATAIAAPSGWTAAQNPAGPALGTNYTPVVAIFYKLSSAGGTESATVSVVAGTYGWAQISEYSGGPFTFTGAQSAHAEFATTATSCATGTTGTNSIADAVAIAIGHPEDTTGSTSALTTPGAWTNLDLEATNSAEVAWSAAYKILSSTGTQSATHNWTTNSYYAGCIAIFEGPSGGGGGITGAGQIASGEVSGAPSIAAAVAPAGFASGQALGTPSVAASVAAAGIASAEQLGQPAIGAAIAPAGIASAQVLGAPSVAAAIGGAGIPSAEAVGAPVVNGAGIFAAGIATAEAFGQPALAARVNASAIGSGEAVGQPTVGAPAPEPARNAGFELGPRFVSFKPLLQRILEARAERRVKPAKERAAKRAKVIEVQAAELVLQDDGAEARFRELMAGWLAQRPVIPPVVTQVDPMQLFMAQVAFRIQQMQAEEQARARLVAQDEEEALIALLLA